MEPSSNVQDCSRQIIIPDSSAIMQTHSNYKSRKSLPPRVITCEWQNTYKDWASGVGLLFFAYRTVVHLQDSRFVRLGNTSIRGQLYQYNGNCPTFTCRADALGKRIGQSYRKENVLYLRALYYDRYHNGSPSFHDLNPPFPCGDPSGHFPPK